MFELIKVSDKILQGTHFFVFICLIVTSALLFRTGERYYSSMILICAGLYILFVKQDNTDKKIKQMQEYMKVKGDLNGKMP